MMSSLHTDQCNILTIQLDIETKMCLIGVFSMTQRRNKNDSIYKQSERIYEILSLDNPFLVIK